jgi:6-phosphofructokinase 1
MSTTKRIAVLTSGGDAPGMNAAIRAVVRTGVLKGYQMFGVRHGYSGLMSGDFVALGPRKVGGIIHQGGTMLGTSRCEALKTAHGQQIALERLQRERIDTLVVIGGNGSQTGAHALAREGAHIVGIASTIDNDLLGTDTSLGTTTALDTALDAIDRLRVTAASHERAFLVEVMGRHSGYLAATAAIAGGAEALVVPEVDVEAESIEEQLRVSRSRGKSHAIIVVAEGSRLNADALLQYFQRHAARLGFELRATRLGHIQRGGAPVAFDRMLGSSLGAAAIDHVHAGDHSILVGWRDGAVKAVALADVADRTKPLDPCLLDLAHALAT